MKRLKIIELFGGIGAPRKALSNLNIDCEFDYVELDKHATNSYNSIYNENFEPKDIKDYSPKWKKPDWVIGGFPCVDLSLAGNRAGFKENTRSNLFIEMVRVCLECEPKNILFENVKPLLSKKHWPLFIQGITPLIKRGYKFNFQKINGKQFIPQNRERIFVLLSKDSVLNIDLSKYECNKVLKDYLEERQESNFFENKNVKQYKNFFVIPRKTDGKLINGSYNRIWKIRKLCGTIPVANKIKIGDIVASEINNYYFFRDLTELECWRLMGFEDKDFDKASKVNKKTNLYKQAGNSIIVPVLEAIFKDLL